VEIPVPYSDGKPDLLRQKEIADELDRIFVEVDGGKKMVEKQLKYFDNLKTSLLSSVFDEK
jgi:hypothetical protein